MVQPELALQRLPACWRDFTWRAHTHLHCLGHSCCSRGARAQDIGLVAWILGIVAVCGLGVSFIFALIYLAMTLFGKAGKHIPRFALPGGCGAFGGTVSDPTAGRALALHA